MPICHKQNWLSHRNAHFNSFSTHADATLVLSAAFLSWRLEVRRCEASNDRAPSQLTNISTASNAVLAL